MLGHVMKNIVLQVCSGIKKKFGERTDVLREPIGSLYGFRNISFVRDLT